jgi:hypothetical protein
MIICNGVRKSLNNFFLSSSFWLVLLFVMFSLSFVLGGRNSIKAELDSFTPVINIGGDAGRAILDTLGRLGAGGLFNSDGTPMTEEQLLAAIEAYVESTAGQDLSDEAVVAGFYASLGISEVPAEATDPEFVAGFAEKVREAATAKAAAQAATENPVSGDPAAPVAGDQPTADPSKEGTVGPKKDGENPGVAPEGLETNDPTKSSADYVDGNPKGEPSDNNQNPLDSSEDQTQDPSQEETNQAPAKTKTKNFGRCSEGLTL